MSRTLKVLVTGKSRSGKSARTGKDYSVSECWVHLEGEPYPHKVELFGVSLAAGSYDVPYSLELFNGRFQVQFDFAKATLCVAK